MIPRSVEERQTRVFATNPDSPEDGRVFIWTLLGWHERVEGDMGNVAFTPIADSEWDLREMLIQVGIEDIEELDNDFARLVREEFGEEAPLYPEAPELSNQSILRAEDDMHLQ